MSVDVYQSGVHFYGKTVKHSEASCCMWTQHRNSVCMCVCVHTHHGLRRQRCTHGPANEQRTGYDLVMGLVYFLQHICGNGTRQLSLSSSVTPDEQQPKPRKTLTDPTGPKCSTNTELHSETQELLNSEFLPRSNGSHQSSSVGLLTVCCEFWVNYFFQMINKSHVTHNWILLILKCDC